MTTSIQAVHSTSVPVAEIEVRPDEEPSMSLGRFTKKLPRGFSIEVNPELKDPSGVVANVTVKKLGRSQEFILHIANHSGKTVNVAAWQL